MVLGAAYRTYVTVTSWMGMDTKHCNHVTRGGNRQPITTCVGECTKISMSVSVFSRLFAINKRTPNGCYTRGRKLGKDSGVSRAGSGKRSTHMVPSLLSFFLPFPSFPLCPFYVLGVLSTKPARGSEELTASQPPYQLERA